MLHIANNLRPRHMWIVAGPRADERSDLCCRERSYGHLLAQVATAEGEDEQCG